MTIQDLSNRVQSVLPLERGLFWGGEWHHPEGVATLQSFNPSNSELLGEVHVARPQDADAAVGAARRAFPAWAATPPLDRSRCLREAAARIRANAVDLALLDAADCGNPVKAMVFDAHIAAPLAAGNTVVLKPPEQAPLSTVRLMELLRDLFSPGVLNCVTGGRETGASLASHPDVAAVGLIGSVPAGKAVMKAASATLKRTLLELGGKNAKIFGPVLSVLRWSNTQDMLLAVNSVEFGLTASIWTQDLITAHQTAQAVQSGYVWVNDASSHFTGAPFGGYKHSGLGREESKDELFEFTQIKNVNVSMIP
jgi:acyl-CoA reductase-like NAD-dependent aldehyde dehydrogenase